MLTSGKELIIAIRVAIPPGMTDEQAQGILPPKVTATLDMLPLAREYGAQIRPEGQPLFPGGTKPHGPKLTL